MHWPEVGVAYQRDLRSRRAWLLAASGRRVPGLRRWWPPVPERPLPPVRRQHLDAITGPLGHLAARDRGRCPTSRSAPARTTSPGRSRSTCCTGTRSAGRPSAAARARCLAYLDRGVRPEDLGIVPQLPRRGRRPGSTRAGSQDCQGRALLALGIAAREPPEVALRLTGDARCSTAALPAAQPTDLAAGRGVRDPRAATPRCERRHADDDEAHVLGTSSARLRAALRGPGPRRRLAVAGGGADVRERPAAARPDRGRTAARRPRPAPRRPGRPRLADRRPDHPAAGAFSPVGNDGWWPRGGSPQPVRPAADRGDRHHPGRGRAPTT